MTSQVIESNGHGAGINGNEALLRDRYKLIKTLGAGGMGQTYIAEDTQLPDHHQCVVKQLKPIRNDSEFFETAKRLFTSEAEILHKLGSHNQIPRLLAHFEYNQEFYLVQELIDGCPLSNEMQLGEQWTESQVIQFLQEILGILAFVQTHNVIHRDIKPDNIMRRHHDNKLVLIDFGAVKQVRMQQLTNTGQTGVTVAVGTPGYMPTEQSMGKPRLSSDIYALGMVAIQALTGLLPTQLRQDEAGEVDWRKFAPEVGDGLAALLAKMVRSFHKQRHQSAMEAFQAIEALSSTETEASASAQNAESQEYTPTDVNPSSDSHYEPVQQQSATSASSEPLETAFNPQAALKAQPEAQKPSHSFPKILKKRRMHFGVGLAAVALCLIGGFGYKAHKQANQQQRQAFQEMQGLKDAGKLSECIGKAESFSNTHHSYLGMSFDNSETHSDVKSLVSGCRQEQSQQQQTLKDIKQLQSEGKLQEAIAQAKVFLQTKSELGPEVQKLLGESQLAYAQQLAKASNYTKAIAVVTEIASDTAVYKEAQRQVSAWSDKILDVAADLYQNGKPEDFSKALQIAGAVPKDSPAYDKAQAAIKQWQKDEAQDNQNFQRTKTALGAAKWDDTLAAANLLIKSPSKAWREQAQLLINQANKGKEPLNIPDGVLNDGSLKLPSDNSPYQEYSLDKIEGKAIAITMESSDFAPYLIVRTPDGQEFSTRNQNGQTVTITIPSGIAGTYKVLANAQNPQGRGRYILKARVIN